MNILFVGNPFIFHQPGGDVSLSPISQFNALANAGGHTITQTLSDAGGGTIQDAWEDTGVQNAQDEITSGTYDIVFVGGEPTKIHDGTADDPDGTATFNTYADLFAGLIESNGGDVIYIHRMGERLVCRLRHHLGRGCFWKCGS
jgi:hypothetical protein